MKPFEEVSYGSIEQSSAGVGSPDAAAASDGKQCTQKESASNLIAVLTGAGGELYTIFS